MKISINQTLYNYPNYNIVSVNRTQKELSKNSTGSKSLSILSLPVYYPNFGQKTDAKFLLKYAEILKCAYSGRKMLHPDHANEIYKKLEKRPNAQSAINFLTQYEGYMHPIEESIFDIFKEADHKGKRNFQEILLENKPEALTRLKDKQIHVLNKGNQITKKLSKEVAEKVLAIRDDAINKIACDCFGRKMPLEELHKIKASPEDNAILKEIYKIWYGLPSASTDVDAFIVKLSKESHLQIAKRLISPCVATIEHITPQSKGGPSCLSNYSLVSSIFNSKKSSLSLGEYDELNPELNIEHHLKKQISDIAELAADKRSEFYNNAYYINDIIERVEKETQGRIKIDIKPVGIPTKKMKVREIYADKFSKKYSTGKLK